ncbi:MAG: TonB-dependent receptor [Myxococcales bacterium]|nr:TonB-dependent receptor [Myxococcales bacterium]
MSTVILKEFRNIFPAIIIAWGWCEARIVTAQEQQTSTSTSADEGFEGPSPKDDSLEKIEIRGRRTTPIHRQLNSSRAIQIVPLEEVHLESADLGEVLARTQGISVQRTGGLGSDAQITLNGLTRDQIRFFIDGIPLALFGFPAGLANVPINLVEEVEVFRGVVPVLFGADALGGAINLKASPVAPDFHGDASYQGGSFGTHRATLRGSYRADNNLWFRVGGYLDDVANNYRVDDVKLADDLGREISASVDRFHDAYRARGLNLEAGIDHQSWTDHLSLRGFYSGVEKEVQHSVDMKVPYGEVGWDQESAGGVIKYIYEHTNGLGIELIAGVSQRRIGYEDLGQCRYNWLGCNVALNTRGETEDTAGGKDGLEIAIDDTTAIARSHLRWQVNPNHEFRLSVSPSILWRQEQVILDRNETERDNILTTMVSGLEYQLTAFQGRLENIIFAKSYLQWISGETESGTSGELIPLSRFADFVGFGNSARLKIFSWLATKASYERAMRLPRQDELLGNPATQTDSNLDLLPEISDNVNIGLELTTERLPVGSWTLISNAFYRSMENYILRMADNSPRAQFNNVGSARSMGFEASARWTSPGEYLILAAAATYVDLRNTTEEGSFSADSGDRIPHRPYLFGNLQARFRLTKLFSDDELRLGYISRYVKSFFKDWESNGDPRFKNTIDDQLSHNITLGYQINYQAFSLSLTGEFQNMTNERLFDFFGVQRPGRAFFAKTTIEL